MTPRAVFPWCGSADWPSARSRSLRGRDAISFNSESGGIAGELDPVDEFDAGPGIGGEQQVAVEVDVIHQARDVRAGGDPEARLDHAAEHDAEAERARRMHHAHR